MTERQPQAETASDDWQNPQIVGRNKEPGHATLVPYADEATALAEDRMASAYFKLLNGIGTTAENLEAAIGGEHYETVEMYPTFAKEAEEEGNQEAAVLFKMIGKIEEKHRERYKRLLEMVKNGTVFKREQPIKWKCSVCGFVVEGTEPPPKCPSCKNPKELYEPASLDL